MPWQQLQFSAPSNKAETLEQLLTEAGAYSITLVDAQDQPVFQTEPGETPIWNQVTIRGLFKEELDLSPLIANLEAMLSDEDSCDLSVELLEDQDWEKTWMADFRPLQFGKRLWVCPNWLSPPDPQAVNIMLDPGLAFGTGTHPTTALCLEWLEQNDLNGKYLVDFGCGSGILAIAAALLGAEKVWAIDNDPQALTATQSNRDNNGIDAETLLTSVPEQFSVDSMPKPADMLVSNILAGPLEQLAERFSTLVSPQGEITLSGILPEQAEKLLECYQPWFDMDPPMERSGWIRLSGIRR